MSELMQRLEGLVERNPVASSGISMVRARGAYGRKPNRKLLNEIAKTGPVDVFHYDEMTDTSTIHTFQNCDPVIESNKENYTDPNATVKGDFWRAASIPLSVVHNLMTQGVNIFDKNDWPKIAALLDSPNYLHFRTAPGTISRRPHREYVQARRRNR